MEALNDLANVALLGVDASKHAFVVGGLTGAAKRLVQQALRDQRLDPVEVPQRAHKGYRFTAATYANLMRTKEVERQRAADKARWNRALNVKLEVLQSAWPLQQVGPVEEFVRVGLDKLAVDRLAEAVYDSPCWRYTARDHEVRQRLVAGSIAAAMKELAQKLEACDELRLPMVACNDAARAAVDAALKGAGLV